MTKTISNSNIYKVANSIKSHVEKGNTGIPNNLTIDNVTYYWHELMYIVSYAVSNPYSSCTIPDLTKPSSPWSGDSINEKITKEDFLKQSANIINFVKNNKNTIPNYVTTIKSRKRVNSNLYAYCFAKILVWFQNHEKVMPIYCTYSSSDVKQASSGLKAYLTNTGCSGMGQCTGYYCACNSLQQCFYRLTGIKVAESTIAGWAGTTSSGTSHAGIETAIAKFNKQYGKNVKITWKNFSDVGWTKLQEYMNKGAVFCHLLYRDQWGHYEVPKQISGDNVIVLNSLGNTCSSPAYCGYIETRTKNTHRRYINGISQKSIAILSI